MISVSPRTAALAVGAMALLLWAAYPAAASAEEPPCYECHDTLPTVSTVHDPVDSGECEACHEDHGDAEELRLVEEGSALCFQCHDEMTGSSVHPPVEDGECTSCHGPHGSNNDAMLIAPADEICFECHDAPEGAVVHAAVDEGCSVCHVPHSSDNSPLLTMPAETICFECHEDKGFNDKVMHAAVDEGCTSCHSPHASENEKLFVANLTLDRLARYEEAQGALCFECHDAEAMGKDGDTGFRNGEENLHSLHLNGGAKPNKYGFIKKKDGQTCVACHLPHSSLQEMLIRTEFECKGIFCYTMRFMPNSTGGTCVVGCHKPKTYSRDATKESSTAKAPGSATEGRP